MNRNKYWSAFLALALSLSMSLSLSAPESAHAQTSKKQAAEKKAARKATEAKKDAKKAAKKAETKAAEAEKSAQKAAETPAPQAARKAPTTERASTQEAGQSTWDFIKKNFGVNYNSFFAGPGPGLALRDPPSFLGTPSDRGLNFFNLISVKYKFSKRFAFDVQFRNQLVVTKGSAAPVDGNAFVFRYQGQRFGISGKLLQGSDWVLGGAINTDLPLRPIMGQIGSERELLFNPGMFATFDWSPKGSRWSFFALLAPRFFFYSDRDAVAQQDIALCGGDPNCDPRSFKIEGFLYINPSINYAVNEKVGVRLGTTLQASKYVVTEYQRDFMPFELGVTYDISPKFSVYTYALISTPLDDSVRRDLYGFTAPVRTIDTLSFNLWLSGVLF